MRFTKESFDGGALVAPRNLQKKDRKYPVGLGPATRNVCVDNSGFLIVPKFATGTAFITTTAGPPGTVSPSLVIFWDASGNTEIRTRIGTTETRGTKTSARQYSAAALVGDRVYATYMTGARVYVDKITLSGGTYTIAATYDTTLDVSGGKVLGVYQKDNRLMVLATGSDGSLYARASKFGDFSDWTILASPTSVSPIDGNFPTTIARATLQMMGEVFVITDKSIVRISSAYPQVSGIVNGIMMDHVGEAYPTIPTGGKTTQVVGHIGSAMIINTAQGVTAIDITSGQSFVIIPGESGDMSYLQDGLLVRGTAASYYIDKELSVWPFVSTVNLGFGRKLYGATTTTYDLDNPETSTLGSILTATVQSLPIYAEDPTVGIFLHEIQIRTSASCATAETLNSDSWLTAKVDVTGQSAKAMVVKTDEGQATEFQYGLSLPSSGSRHGQTVTVSGILLGRLLSITIDGDLGGE